MFEAISFGNKSLRNYARIAVNRLITLGNTNVNIHHIISDKESVDEFVAEWVRYGSDILYHVLLPLMPSGRSSEGVTEGTFEYLEEVIEKNGIKNVAFGAHFIKDLRDSKIKTWLYDEQSFSKNIILTKDLVQITPSSFDFTLDIDKPSVKQAYDNAGAYSTLLSIMERNSNINVEFRLDKENYHYAWVEAKGVAGFKYYLKNEAFNGIIKYLTKGEVTDFDPAPLEYEKAKFTNDFYIMNLFVDKGIVLQCTPLFRERLEYVTAFLPCRKGKITFRVKRTDEIVNYLREAGQCL